VKIARARPPPPNRGFGLGSIDIAIAAPIAVTLCAAISALWLKLNSVQKETATQREDSAVSTSELKAAQAQEIARIRGEQIADVRNAATELARLTGEVARAVERMVQEQQRASEGMTGALDRLSNLIAQLVGREIG